MSYDLWYFNLCILLNQIFQRFTPWGCKDIGIRRFEFWVRNKFLYFSFCIHILLLVFNQFLLVLLVILFTSSYPLLHSTFWVSERVTWERYKVSEWEEWMEKVTIMHPLMYIVLLLYIIVYTLQYTHLNLFLMDSF